MGGNAKRIYVIANLKLKLGIDCNGCLLSPRTARHLGSPSVDGAANVIEASWLALVDSLEFWLVRAGVPAGAVAQRLARHLDGQLVDLAARDAEAADDRRLRFPERNDDVLVIKEVRGRGEPDVGR